MKTIASRLTNISVFIIMTFITNACDSDEGDVGRVVVGRSNVLFSLNELQYQDPYVVQVTDIDGSAIANVSVTVSLKNISYNKGVYQRTDSGWVSIITATCTAEDINNNGFIEPGEDINNNERLDPTNAATITAHPKLEPTFQSGTNLIVTDESGFGYFSITYPKSESLWSRVEVKVNASIKGTEQDAFFTQTLLVLEDDISDESVDPPGGVLSSYGQSTDCINEN